MCSSELKEVEAFKSELFRAGIRSEISSNPVASALGIARLEIHIYDNDLIEASRIQQEFLATRTRGGASEGWQKSSANGRARREVVELQVEPVRPQLRAPGRPDPSPGRLPGRLWR